jgi:hypothetical protein
MKKLSILLMAIAAIMIFAIPAQAQWMTNALAFDDSLRSAATADTIWSAPINIEGCDYVAFNLKITRVHGGGAGAGILAVQGLPSFVTHSAYNSQVAAWQNLFAADFGDSISIVNTWALSSTSDIYKNFTLIPLPYGQKTKSALKDDYQFPRQFVICALPFSRVRIRIIDTNWTIHGTVAGDVILHRMGH